MLAGEAAAGAYAAEAAIPIVGPALAPAVAASAFAGTLAVGMAQHGALVPEDMGIFAHAGEMILPEHISTPLQQAIPAISHFSAASRGLATGGAPTGTSGATGLSGGRDGGGSSTSSMTHISVSALDSASLNSFLHRNQRSFISAVKGAVRNGHKL